MEHRKVYEALTYCDAFFIHSSVRSVQRSSAGLAVCRCSESGQPHLGFLQRRHGPLPAGRCRFPVLHDMPFEFFFLIAQIYNYIIILRRKIKKKKILAFLCSIISNDFVHFFKKLILNNSLKHLTKC